MGYRDELEEGRLEKNVFVIFADEVREKMETTACLLLQIWGWEGGDLNSETVREVRIASLLLLEQQPLSKQGSFWGWFLGQNTKGGGLEWGDLWAAQEMGAGVKEWGPGFSTT